MNHRKIIIIFFIIAVLAIGTSYAFSGLTVCHKYPWACNEFFLQVRSLLFILSLPLLLLTPILFFVRREAFVLWAKFAGVAFPLMLGILLYTFNNAPTPGGFGLAGLIPDEQLASATLPLLFVLISIILISVESWRLRGKTNLP